MSGNPKPTTAGGQQLRYSNQYQSMATQLPPRESFQLPTQNYVQQPNQTGNQGTGLRGISAQTGPPNQAQTPPNQDHKVQQAPQQPSLNIYSQQNAVRPAQTSFYRAAGPPNQQTRMANNQHRGQQQIYQATQPQFLPVHLPMTYHQQFFNTQQRQNYMQQQVAFVPGQQIFPQAFLQSTGLQPQAQLYQYYMPRTAPPTQPATAPTTQNQAPIPAMPVTQNIQPQQNISRQQKRRANAIPIINPVTGINMLDEMYEQQDGSHPPSGESSARQTPQPAIPSREVHGFAKQRLSDDEQSSYDEDRHSSSTGEPINMSEPVTTNVVSFHPPQQQPPQQAVHTNPKYEQLVQTSNLKVYAKEFVSTSVKETPVVSANCDSEEVTLPSKKGRESPAKGRKREMKNINKAETATPVEVQAKEVPHVVEKQDIVVKSAAVKTAKVGGKPDGSNLTDANANEGAASQSQETEMHISQNAKSKQNASQRRETQKTNQKSGTASASVPQPQPAKPSSKTSKKNEINSKGVSKEGTEMDVFQISDTVNANNSPTVATAAATTNDNDVINANVVIQTPNNITSTVVPVTNSVEANNKKNEISQNDVTAATTPSSAPAATKAPTTQPPAKSVDVMDIFGGNVPQPKPFAPPPEPAQTDASGAPITRDETDRINVNDKNVIAKNEANAAKSGGKPDLPYKEGQWAPFNKQGEMRYDFEFLMACRNLPIAKVKPSNLPDVIDGTLDGNRPRLPDNRYSMGRTDFTNPPFMSPYGGKNSSMKGSSVTKHPSLTGKMGSKSGKSTNGSMASGNKISISLREDIKLHVTENAWKPNRLSKMDLHNDEERKTEELYKKVRGVLNKLTPEKFDKLLNQIKALKVDTLERLEGVIKLIFEKAVDEPNFSVAYARMCKELMTMNVTMSPTCPEIVNFRKLLLNRCQEEFEKQSKDETDTTGEKKKQINECTDPERKKELELELEELERRIRRRSVGNVRFIGELFKNKMLTYNIMTVCLRVLLNNKDEDSLECMCKLLSTIGNEMETVESLEPFIIGLRKIVDNKESAKISSRIRFMIQDVIDLRKNNWVPRRQDMNPTTMDQIQRDAENEHLKQIVNNSVPSTPRKDDRMSDMKRPGKNSEDGDWTTQQPHSRSQRFQSITVQKDKLKSSKAISKDEPLSLGTPKMFSSWTKGATIKPATDVPTTTNKFALLDSGSLDGDKKISDNRYNSKGSSLERNYGKQHHGGYEGRGSGSRSGSQQRSKDLAGVSSSVIQPRVVPQQAPVVIPTPTSPPPAAVPTTAPTAAVPSTNYPQMNDDQRERFFKTCFEEFINDTSKLEECEADIRLKFPPSYMPTMVTNGYMRVLEMKSIARKKCGVLFAGLISAGTLPLEKYCVGLEEIFYQVEDLIIDIPTIWTCLAEILVPVICEDALPLNRLMKSCEVLKNNGKVDLFLEHLFEHIVREKDIDFLKNVWKLSELKLEDCLPKNLIEGFVKKTNYEFMLGGKATEDSRQGFNYEQIEKKLLEFFNTNVPFDTIKNWITANVGERVEEEQFVRTLATAIYKYSIIRKKFVPERLNMHTKLFSHYVDNNQAFELQCLFALQSVVKELEHPAGLLLNIVNKLSEDSILSQESFLAWEKNEDPAEKDQKGVALMQLTSFFTHLKENEEDDDEGSMGDKDA